MPRTHAWTLLACDLSEDDSDTLLQSMKAHTTSKSQLAPCTLCASGTPHSMRYSVLACACKQCKAVTPFAYCGWRGKKPTCLESNNITLSELGKHFSVANPHKKPTISRIQRRFIQDMTKENLTPLRILHAMARKFDKILQELPELRKVQNAVNHYRRTKLGSNDRYKELVARVGAAAFSGQEAEHDAFTFTRNTNGSGKPIVGDGSDANSFVVGVTTKALLRSADRDPAAFILHIDATFQLAQASYPVIVCGMSDGARKFHLLALFITPQLEEQHYTDAVAALHTVYAKVFNAIKNVFGTVGKDSYLMCFYHVVAKVRLALKERTHRLYGDKMAQVYRGVYDLHCATSEAEFLARKAQIITSWKSYPELDNFRLYMEKQWLQGNFSNWQIFSTPAGLASTNNPCETFNRAFKRDYTQKRKLKLAVLLQQMLYCCSHRSMAPVEFEQRRTTDKRLLTRATALRRGDFLREHTFSWNSISFLVDNPGTNIVRVLATPALRFYIPFRGRSKEALDVAAQFSVNYARMELKGQPSTGWDVDLDRKHCPCRYHIKMLDCVHFQFALQLRNYVDGDGERLMVNRSKKRRRDANTGQGAEPVVGRPRHAGHALQRE